MRTARPSHPPDSSTAIEFLRRHEGGAALLPAARRILDLRRDLLGLIPPSLRDTCDVTGFDDDVVIVRVLSASGAAKLRQTLPRLRDGLVERGWKVGAIRMQVRPATAAPVARRWRAGPTTAIPAAGVAAFDDLHRHLEESPLRTAVERLLRRRRAER